MSLPKIVYTKRFAACLGMSAVAAVCLVFGNVLADSGPVLKNVNPQGLVTSVPKITLDTEDLARCRYSTSDTNYDSMNGNLTSPDGLYHSAELGSLGKGSYTYYVRCWDYEGNSNQTSTVIKFNVNDTVCLSGDCATPPVNPPVNPPANSAEPILSNLLPSGTVRTGSVTMSLKTNERASCRYSWYNRTYDAMSLQFSTSDGLTHTAVATLWQVGQYYNYNVRCKNDANMVNQIPGKISFYYPDPNPKPYVPPVEKPKVVIAADTTPPVISSLAPSGDLNTETISISCTTDEAADCKYGTTDGEYDSLTDAMDAAGGLSHSKSVTLDASGNYTYYVRCKDSKGNKNTVSSQIGFNYTAPAKAGPVISNAQPKDVTVYQQNVGMALTTDKVADCRFSKNDVDYESMQEIFSTNDGFLHQAAVSLEDFGSYTYYVRCKDKEGNADDQSEVISFEYKKSEEPPAGDKPCEGTDCVVTTPAEPVTCAETKMDENKDGTCDKTMNCLCDQDCPASGDNVDPDCANIKTTPPNNSWIAIVLIGLLLVIIIVIIIIIIKRRSNDEEEVELP